MNALNETIRAENTSTLLFALLLTVIRPSF